MRRLRIAIEGAVQGVGFRQFVYRLATELGLAGQVWNDARGVIVEVEGPREALGRLLERLPRERPPHSVVHALSSEWLDPVGLGPFAIRPSDGDGARSASILPDLATCEACLADVRDPADRRHGYPFTNCTHCGPRFSIVRALPYDRPNTTMRGFAMCPACRAEYDDPRDRRFHAQPTACPRCGPRLALWDRAGATLARDGEALAAAASALAAGRIVAVKGLGGFHLLCDARDPAAVSTLRARKARWDKPLALMVADLAAARSLCEVPEAAATLLASQAAPIVLLRRRDGGATVAREVAPDTADLGLMLPATPLHHLLCARLPFPLVATSGNLSEEPICTDEREAVERLGPVANLLLVHDRPIERHVDDSVAFVVRGEARLVRRARGFAPLPVRVARDLPPILAVGAGQKVVVAVSVGRSVFLSQHVGDLETPAARAAFEQVIADLLRLYEVAPAAVAHDLHPDLASSEWARVHAGSPPRVPVQHHHAHLAACLADAGERGPALGVTFDGTGLGTDGSIWGGELLLGGAGGVRRVASLLPFRLAGGDAAVREPRRVALALLLEVLGPAALERDDLAPIRSFSAGERRVLARMIERGVNAPWASSAGRLFDGVAALLGLHPRTTFDGQAAMALQHLADPAERDALPLPVRAAPTRDPADRAAPDPPPWILDWRDLVAALLEGLARGTPREVLAARFHNALVAAIVEVARITSEPLVALSGGCFQNRLLAERAADRLEAAGFRPLLHRQVPTNDGGIALGQVLVAAARLDGAA